MRTAHVGVTGIWDVLVCHQLRGDGLVYLGGCVDDVPYTKQMRVTGLCPWKSRTDNFVLCCEYVPDHLSPYR